MVDKNFQADDLVWAKTPNFPHWPGKIIASDDVMIQLCGPLDEKKREQYVYFFGTENYASVSIKNILPHSQEMFDKHDKKKRISKDLRAAIDDMKEYCLSSVAEDLNSEEPISNDEDHSCDLISPKVEDVTEHSIDNSDDLSRELRSSEVDHIVSCEPAISDAKLVSAEPEIGFDFNWTSEVEAQQVDVDSSCDPTMPKVKRPCVTVDETPVIQDEFPYLSTFFGDYI